MPGNDLPDRVSSTSDEIVTQVVDVRNVSAAALVPILRPMVPQYAHLAAYPAGNILIISDRASNVNRMIRIIRRIDQIGNADVDIISLSNASAAEIVRVVNSLYQGAAAAEGAAVKVVADERSNSVLIGGDQSQRLRIKALIAHLDTPLESGGDTRVRYLHYADAEKIAPKLKEQITGIAASSAGATTGGAAGAQASPLAQAEKNAMIWADPSNNALVITAPPKIMHAVMNIIDKLDIRKPQVLVEAIIAEVDVNKDSELGVNWAAFSQGGDSPDRQFRQPRRWHQHAKAPCRIEGRYYGVVGAHQIQRRHQQANSRRYNHCPPSPNLSASAPKGTPRRRSRCSRTPTANPRPPADILRSLVNHVAGQIERGIVG